MNLNETSPDAVNKEYMLVNIRVFSFPFLLNIYLSLDVTLASDDKQIKAHKWNQSTDVYQPKQVQTSVQTLGLC